jgi:tRNA threonylcarbamoyladenosine biosynthesis protein TsaE
MQQQITFNSLSEIDKAAEQFLNLTKGYTKFAFFGEMGVGKTTFIKAICTQLNVIDTVTSPTFAIINEYHTKNNEKVFHFDFYRIKNTAEVFDIGYEDYFYSDHYCFIEWPELIDGLLPDGFVKVSIVKNEQQTRIIHWDI